VPITETAEQLGPTMAKWLPPLTRQAVSHFMCDLQQQERRTSL